MSSFEKRSDLPLNALRAFEAAARLGSFTLAARELNVTQGAVSRQIKLLEERLQKPLFRREYRKIILSRQGRRLLPDISEALDLMTASLQKLNRSKTLNLKVMSSFAVRWLIPHFNCFQSRFPEIIIRFTASNENVDFKHEDFDMGITFGGEKIPGVRRQRLFTERLTPVYAPQLLNVSPPIETVEDLRHHRLLHNEPDQANWRTWAAQVGVKGLGFDQGQVFETDDAALQAAVAGIGVALSDLFFIREALESGRLVAPFSHIEMDTCSYYFTWPQYNDHLPGITAFRKWLKDEIRRGVHKIDETVKSRD